MRSSGSTKERALRNVYGAPFSLLRDQCERGAALGGAPPLGAELGPREEGIELEEGDDIPEFLPEDGPPAGPPIGCIPPIEDEGGADPR